MVIDRYLIREITQTLLAVLGVLLLIFMGRYFALYLADASVGDISGAIVLDMLLLRTLTSLNIMVPFALYTAVLLAFGRLYKDSEMTALAACGVGPGRVIGTVAMMALLCSALVAVLSFWTSPWAYERALQVQEQAQAGTAFASVVAGQFNEIGSAHQVFYVQGLSEDRTALQDVFIQREGDDGKLEVFSARRGYQSIDPDTGERYLVLVDGYRYQGQPGDADFTISRYEKNAVRLQDLEAAPLRRKRWAIPSEQLWHSPRLEDQAELQWRFAMPLATMLLAILAVLLSRASPRQGRFAKLFLAILVFVIYYNSLGMAMSWVQRGIVSPALGLWWVHAGLAALVAVLAVRHWGGRWLWYRLAGTR
ncbi:MAG: LPS export ABC transporter permease LptF [Gammaproteobacteria bacterium]|nr:LPS export ABC transporter permease LptF [Gammaproteobacteria bacterium]